MQLVWVCLDGTQYGPALHIILLLRLARMRRVFTLMKVSLLSLCSHPHPNPRVRDEGGGEGFELACLESHPVMFTMFPIYFWQC